MQLTIGASQTMSSLEIAELTGKNHADVMRDIRKMLKDLAKDQSSFADIFLDTYNREQPMYKLPYEETVCLLTGYDAKARMAVIKRWQELEAKQAPKLPTNYIAALEALVISEKEKELAIATKAEIGNRREATAMNTASQAVKKVEKLQIELDQSKRYASVKKMSLKYHGQEFDWRKLKSAAQDIGIPSMEVFDANYGTVKAYHECVWLEAYALSIV